MVGMEWLEAKVGKTVVLQKEMMHLIDVVGLV